MHRIATIVVFITSVSACAADLVSLDVNEGPVENGKTLKMEFRELERRGDESEVRVTFHSGGSVSSSMFILKGGCAIARSRGAKFFRNVVETRGVDGEWNYTIAFANASNAVSLKIPSPPKPASEHQSEALANGVFSVNECQMLGFW